MRYTILLLVCLSSWLRAQDPLYADYSSAAPLLNPALTGFIRGQATTRAGVTARDQWRSFLETANYRSVGVAVDHRFCGDRQGDYFGLGLSLNSDWQGQPSLRRTDGYLTGAYTKNLGKNYYSGTSLSVGAELGFVQYHLDTEGMTFDEQFDDPGSPGERFDRYNLSVLDYGVGVLYAWRKDQRSSLSATAGLSIRHLGKPAVTFYDDGSLSSTQSDSTAQLATRWAPHVSGTLPVGGSDRTSLSLFATYDYQRPFQRAYLRMLFNLEPGRRVRGQSPGGGISLGGGYRLTRGVEGLDSESLVAVARLYLGQFDIGLNYDINVSSLRQSTSGAGALELSMTMRFGEGGCFYCPSF